MKASVFVGTSLDEFIARLDGALDFLPEGGGEPHGFLRAGLIQRLIVTRVPVLIGAGISLLGAVPRDIPLKHIATRQYASGLVQSEYELGTGGSNGHHQH
jgi:dihydrofolate reductase